MSGLRIIPPLAALLWLTTAAAPVHADGPGAYRPPKPRAALPAPISEQSAIDAYTLGYAAVQRADHHQALADASLSDAEKKAAERAAGDFYKESLRHFEEAIRLDGSMHEAYTYLGYANRKLGNHTEALAAYEQALRIFPDYPHAIEYQGQAYLGMKRLNEARFNYLRLYALNKGQAAKLLQAMRAWVDAHRTDAETHEFAEWVAHRSEITRSDVPYSSW